MAFWDTPIWSEHKESILRKSTEMVKIEKERREAQKEARESISEKLSSFSGLTATGMARRLIPKKKRIVEAIFTKEEFLEMPNPSFILKKLDYLGFDIKKPAERIEHHNGDIQFIQHIDDDEGDGYIDEIIDEYGTASEEIRFSKSIREKRALPFVGSRFRTSQCFPVPPGEIMPDRFDFNMSDYHEDNLKRYTKEMASKLYFEMIQKIHMLPMKIEMNVREEDSKLIITGSRT